MNVEAVDAHNVVPNDWAMGHWQHHPSGLGVSPVQPLGEDMKKWVCSEVNEDNSRPQAHVPVLWTLDSGFAQTILMKRVFLVNPWCQAR